MCLFACALSWQSCDLTNDDFDRPIRRMAATVTPLSGALSVKAHCLPFSQVPHTTRLFTDLLTYSPNIRPFYPRSPFFQEWMKEEAGRISYDPSRRERVADILERQNQSWNASPSTLAN